MSGQEKIYQMVTDRIVSLLENGVAPWRKPWTGGKARGAMPANLVSKKEYRGINAFILHALGFSSQYFVSFKQATEAGATVRKNEKGCPVIFWMTKEYEDAETGEKKECRILRYYTVFNLDQLENLDPRKVPAEEMPDEIEFNAVEAAVSIIDAMPNRPEIRHDKQRAYYKPSADYVNMPKPETFTQSEEYYSTLFHELAHSTGHESRLNRRNSGVIRFFGDADYSKEELVAEMTASFLCGVCGIVQETIENSAAYVQSWIKVLKGDARLAVQAAAQAQRAADYIRGITWE